MLVEFCDQLFGNSTPRCSKAGLSGLPITASRISHSISSKGCTPAVENRRSIERPRRPFLGVLVAVLDIELLLSQRLLGGAAAGSSFARTEVAAESANRRQIRAPSIHGGNSAEWWRRRGCGRGRPSGRNAAREVAGEAIAAVKPKLRGVSHEWAFFVSLFLGAGLIVAAKTPKATLAVAIYAVSLSALLGTSALYHRVNWTRPNVRRWMRRLDHSMIFFLIAGTYTPFALLVLHGPLAERHPRRRLDRGDRRGRGARWSGSTTRNGSRR